MTFQLSDDTKAILLLCAVFGDRNVKPLSTSEYHTLVKWLVGKEMRPQHLLIPKVDEQAAHGAGIESSRLEMLLRRGVNLGFAVEQWERNGIWIVSRSDGDYPSRYKKHLKEKAPPILFGVGDRSLLEGGGLAIVGSRNVDKEGQDFTRQVAALCVRQKINVVSGGARGVDNIAMEETLKLGGTVLGVLADSLLKKSIEKVSRKALASGKLLLLSPYHPEGTFSVGAAMGRNKLIYALSDYALVVSADHKKGGTWAGAEEELKRVRPLPVFVRVKGNVPEGNRRILALGARAWPDIEPEDSLKDLLTGKSATERSSAVRIFETANLFDDVGEPVPLSEGKSSQRDEKTEKTDRNLSDVPVERPSACIPHDGTDAVKKERDATISVNKADDLYQVVLPLLLNTLTEPLSSKDLASLFDVSEAQIRKWLNRGVEEGKVKKITKPVRYCRNEADSPSPK